MERVNVRTVRLDEPLDEAGFRHVAATLGPRLGARRIGASVYEGRAGTPIWPYHYHHGIDEWLLVIAGEPVLRERAGERVLAAGDLVGFPSGPLGAHTVEGPGRFAIFASGQFEEPYLSVYPDSDKVSGPEGILLRSSAVTYWHGEGTGGSSPAAEAVEPDPRPGTTRLDASIVDLGPGEAPEPYRYAVGREEWRLVLAGSPILRHPAGEDRLEAGDLVCFADGPVGAHQLLNRTDEPIRTLSLLTAGQPVNVCLPDEGEWLIQTGPGPQTTRVRGRA